MCFAGDALITVFASGNLETYNDSLDNHLELETLSALFCALKLKKLDIHGLTVHIGIATGPYTLTTLGGYLDKWTQMLSGPCVNDVAECVRNSGPREIVATWSVVDTLPSFSEGQMLISDMFAWQSVGGCDGKLCLLVSIDEVKCLGMLHHVLIKQSTRPHVPGGSSDAMGSRRRCSRDQDAGCALLEIVEKFLPAGVVYAILNSPKSCLHGTQRESFYADDSCFQERHSAFSPSSKHDDEPRRESHEEEVDSYSEVDDVDEEPDESSALCPLSNSTDTLAQGSAGAEAATGPLMLDCRFPAECHTDRPLSCASSGSCTGSSVQLAGGVQQVAVLFMMIHEYSAVPGGDQGQGLLHLQDVFHAIQQAVHVSNGFMRQFIVDDKGCVLVAFWSSQVGATEVQSFARDNSSTIPHDQQEEDNCLRALSCAFEIKDTVESFAFACSISVTSGEAFCGPIGSPIRQEYAVLGHTVNRCARLMCCGGENGGVLVDSHTCSLLIISLRRQKGQNGEEGGLVELCCNGGIDLDTEKLPLQLSDDRGLLGRRIKSTLVVREEESCTVLSMGKVYCVRRV
jgi:class 3 adenylate cyclase